MNLNLKLAWRNLFKNQQFTLLNIVGLASGLTCILLISLWVGDELSIDKFNEKDSRLYKAMYNITLPNEVLTIEHTPYPLVETLVTEMPEVEDAVAVNGFMDWFAGQGVASSKGKGVKVQGVFASKSFFNLFTYKLIEGSNDQVLENKNGVVISERLAKKLFHRTENLIGTPLKWDHKLQFKLPLQISGVFKNPPANASRQFDIVFNFALMLEAEESANSWKSTYSETYFTLKAGTNVAAFSQKIVDISKRKAPTNANCSIFMQKFSDQYLYGNYKNGAISGGRIQYVELFSLIALFILLIACINFMNLYTAQAMSKMKEVGVKKSLGANRGQLIGQFYGETVLLTGIGVLVAVLMVWALLPYFNEITGKQLRLVLDLPFIAAALVITLLTSAIAGIYPAIYLSGFKPIAVLKGNLATSTTQVFTRKSLVVFQFTLSFFFVVGFMVINQQIKFVQSKNLGFDRAQVISFQRQGDYQENPEAFLTALKRLPDVVNVGAMPMSILDGEDAVSGFSWRGEDADKAYLFKSPRIGYDVIETLGIAITQGRPFSKKFNDDFTKIILNESALKMMQLENPIGKVIKQGNFECEIIGVVKDFQYGSMHQAIVPLIFRFRDASNGQHVFVKINAGKNQEALKAIEAKYRAFHPQSTFDYTFLDDDYQQLYTREMQTARLSNYFAALAILISCLGLFGLATFTAQKRQKEIGIRKVLGASIIGVMNMLNGDFLKLVLIAIGIATPISYFCMNKWLAHFAYRIDIQWWVFVLAGVLAIGIAFLTISFQSVKAALANPVKSLKSE